MIEVEVAYALPTVQKVIKVKVPSGTTVLGAAQQSGIAKAFSGLDLENSDMGVFGKTVKAATHILQAGDRVEIYRPLQADPKEARKKRAARNAESEREP